MVGIRLASAVNQFSFDFPQKPHSGSSVDPLGQHTATRRACNDCMG
jgi:hypothetical protein